MATMTPSEMPISALKRPAAVTTVPFLMIKSMATALFCSIGELMESAGQHFSCDRSCCGDHSDLGDGQSVDGEDSWITMGPAEVAGDLLSEGSRLPADIGLDRRV